MNDFSMERLLNPLLRKYLKDDYGEFVDLVWSGLMFMLSGLRMMVLELMLAIF